MLSAPPAAFASARVKIRQPWQLHIMLGLADPHMHGNPVPALITHRVSKGGSLSVMIAWHVVLHAAHVSVSSWNHLEILGTACG